MADTATYPAQQAAPMREELERYLPANLLASSRLYYNTDDY
ncbi:hypothetical protein [Thiohalocapsa halophila]|nr:hypothetical protein [Thiohalocapsa halophila]